MQMRYCAPLAWVPSGWQVLPAAAGAVTAARLMNVRTMSSRFLMRSSSVPGHEGGATPLPRPDGYGVKVNGAESMLSQFADCAGFRPGRTSSAYHV